MPTIERYPYHMQNVPIKLRTQVLTFAFNESKWSCMIQFELSQILRTGYVSVACSAENVIRKRNRLLQIVRLKLVKTSMINWRWLWNISEKWSKLSFLFTCPATCKRSGRVDAEEEKEELEFNSNFRVLLAGQFFLEAAARIALCLCQSYYLKWILFRQNLSMYSIRSRTTQAQLRWGNVCRE